MKVEKRLFIKIIVFFALLALLFLLLFLSNRNIRANNRAVQYFNKGNFESAAQTFDNELKNSPRNYVVINNSSGADYKLNKLDEAQTKYTVVINSTDAVKEDKFAALYGMGNVEFLKNNFEESSDFYKEALKLNPNDRDAKYNLELALLKLDEKNNKQENKDDKYENDRQKQNQREQDLKKQMEQNDKAQKENEKKLQEENGKKGADSKKGDNEKQKELEKEKKELDKHKQEISDKIKNLIDAQKDKEQSKQKQSEVKNEKKLQENKQTDKSESARQNQIKKDDNKDMRSVMFLNYYNEADKNLNKLKNRSKEPLINQPQEDW
ncbi:MAG: tetratricopeptide repeat protein [Endomicrobium sp.]|jgi:tetratricopeptide (TPR) repeat protein|nr:tetratricopeptide repeat protein [Endomicrobium sp.]